MQMFIIGLAPSFLLFRLLVTSDNKICLPCPSSILKMPCITPQGQGIITDIYIPASRHFSKQPSLALFVVEWTYRILVIESSQLQQGDIPEIGSNQVYHLVIWKAFTMLFKKQWCSLSAFLACIAGLTSLSPRH